MANRRMLTSFMFVSLFFPIVVNIFLGSVLPAFHLEDSAVYAMIVYLLVLAFIMAFELYLACSQDKSAEDYRVLARPHDDEVEVAPVRFSQAQSDLRKVGD